MKTEDKNNIPKVRLAVIGKSNVGKSALTVRYLTRRYIGEYRSNTDLLYRQTLTINNAALEAEIVDVCSCELQAFPEEAIYWADACLVVYDITDRGSFSQASDLLQKVLQLRQMPVILLGNKADLEHLRQVEEVEGRTLAIQNNCQFYEVSVAENSAAIYTAFDHILSECRSIQSTQKTRKFSVSKMIGTLIGSNNSNKVAANTTQGGTVVVCHKSDLYKSRILRRRQNFTATASLWLSAKDELDSR